MSLENLRLKNKALAVSEKFLPSELTLQEIVEDPEAALERLSEGSPKWV